MERAGMVHALEKIQQLLTPDGILLDIHPTNEMAAIVVRLREQLIPAGWLNESDDYVEYEWADEALQRVVDVRRFALERVGTFEFVWHADTLNDLRAYLAEEWKDAIIDDLTAMRIEELLKLPVHDKEILVSEAIRIARYRLTLVPSPD
jgi:nuclear transport factor 2 (NTF2) superfamily protein